ncbi:MAG: hypothetical protein RL521_87 [Bacteroidota bacterium]|jgi:hypothetical protein
MKFSTTLLVIIIIALSSCKTEKIAMRTTEKVRPRSAIFVLKQNEKKWMPYHQAGMKIEGGFSSPDEELDFKANVRIAKDSAVWMSISPALGIEIARTLVLKDSIKVLSKIPDNKFAFITGIEDLEKFVHFDLDLEDLQSLIFGQPIGIDRIGGKFKSDEDTAHYIIQTRYKRRIKKSLELIQNNSDTLANHPDENERIKAREKRMQQRMEEDGLILSKYWFDAETYLLKKTQFNDAYNGRLVEIENLQWNVENPAQQYPSLILVHVNDNGKLFSFSWEVNRCVTDRTFEFQFEIPEGYPIKKSL